MKKNWHIFLRAQAGFTFIELLVVTVIIGVLASVVMVSFVSSSEHTRDARRKKDLAALQAALEVYKLNTGAYPSHTLCNAAATWPGCRTPWIPGMNDDYISELPQDPRQNATTFIGNSDEPEYTYNYIRTSETSYHLLTRLENVDDDLVNGDEFGYTGEGIYVVTQPK
ncbi:prepilin-type N-terminal cleavage/methylation domain-containing protein [Candidatus Woesebacteria bacterium]|nr:prepilin-type N-terminal cleavage/methylation domain-containing protein [Candidatus Woesebacteria bacterium]MCD8507249.1 prepilin-type N-terminal cleavage/methylation domain-containing protein [Candidatus Woesebacteria bacterium]MCD8526616.1 prepilin-type N-terminal cleavage/methylation domain-containing protein [Candidatus Woesebacteria bacterium]MCD8546012.1 prepilin-type N-terminal cleavage/methylation domain-containing protein [Candidatus Woesebacteria bacterium]